MAGDLPSTRAGRGRASERRQEAGPVRAEDAFDPATVHQWLARLVPDLVEPPEVRQFGGGASNLTYLLDYGDHRFVLRRPPRGTKAASAHDMAREVLVQERLGPLLPFVPRIIGFCPDPGLIGSEFYVMEHLEGVNLRRELPDGVTLDAPSARHLGETVIDTLADLHAVDVDAAGLGELGRGPGAVRRQVEGWSRRYRAARTDDVPDGEALMTWLDAHQPPDVALCLVHGDWKFDNLVLDLTATPRIVGVLDWEMATVGDPLMDLGASLAYWITEDDPDPFTLLRSQPTHLPGMPTREEVVARYLQRSQLDLGPWTYADNWTFYEVFGLFRLAVIIQQIWFRYRAGQTSNPAFAAFGGAVRILLDRAQEVVALR